MCVRACVLGHMRANRRENESERMMWLRTLGRCWRDETEFLYCHDILSTETLLSICGM